MRLTDGDLEQLELYLDGELGEAEARELTARASAEPLLAGELERLRGDRAMRMSAMSVAFDVDAASIERLVASVRTAQASEALQLRRRSSWLPMRSILAAAACMAFGLTLGVTLQRQHGRNAGVTAAPAAVSNTFAGSNASFGPAGLQPQGASVVSVLDKDGRELFRVRFDSPEGARQFMDRVNNRGEGAPPVYMGDVRILDEPY